MRKELYLCVYPYLFLCVCMFLCVFVLVFVFVFVFECVCFLFVDLNLHLQFLLIGFGTVFASLEESGKALYASVTKATVDTVNYKYVV